MGGWEGWVPAEHRGQVALQVRGKWAGAWVGRCLASGRVGVSVQRAQWAFECPLPVHPPPLLSTPHPHLPPHTPRTRAHSYDECEGSTSLPWSKLPGQAISACPDPPSFDRSVWGLNHGQGRGAPEIDIFEVV